MRVHDLTLKQLFVEKKIQKRPSDQGIGKPKLSNTHIRHNTYIDLACKGTMLTEKLPPSERAPYYYGLQTHYPIMLWPLIDNFELEATDQRWKLEEEVITPVMDDKEIATESLTKVIRCNCKVYMIQI